MRYPSRFHNSILCCFVLCSAVLCCTVCCVLCVVRCVRLGRAALCQIVLRCTVLCRTKLHLLHITVHRESLQPIIFFSCLSPHLHPSIHPSIYSSIHPSAHFLLHVGNSCNETRFAEDDGLDTLFEFLEVCPYVLRLPIMRILSDLLANADSVPFVR